jgi:hypothetical protein
LVGPKPPKPRLAPGLLIMIIIFFFTGKNRGDRRSLDNNLKEKVIHEISRIDNLYNGIKSIILMISKNIGEGIPNSFQ